MFVVVDYTAIWTIFSDLLLSSWSKLNLAPAKMFELGWLGLAFYMSCKEERAILYLYYNKAGNIQINIA